LLGVIEDLDEVDVEAFKEFLQPGVRRRLEVKEDG